MGTNYIYSGYQKKEVPIAKKEQNINTFYILIYTHQVVIQRASSTTAPIHISLRSLSLVCICSKVKVLLWHMMMMRWGMESAKIVVNWVEDQTPPAARWCTKICIFSLEISSNCFFLFHMEILNIK